MKQIKCLIIDDEELAVRLIKSYIEKVPFLTLIAAVNSGFEAIEILNSKNVDLVFVDIEMPELSGMEFIRSLDRKPAFIFITAYREYAADAFEIDAIDYLVKPVSFDRFLKAVNKFYKSNPEKADAYTISTIQLRADRKIHQIHISNISYIEGLKDYIKIFFDSRDMLIFKETLSSIEKKLTPFGFIRCHKSYLIPISKIKSFNAEGIEIKDVYIPIGRSYKVEVLKILENR
ncbi:MAG: response regulator transcription factor [Cyclobacteriaceae bacterium]|nr:response regulator transcription factor [Cyclobacteriaceae bacterium]